MKKLILIATALLIISSFCLAQNGEPLWLRYPAISPDGQTIIFAYQGDIYQVDAKGGAARPLTLHEAYDYSPTWSPDGKTIAFSSTRYGNSDVYVMPANGGKATRLTFHSSGDGVTGFTHDGKQVLFASSRLDEATNQQFPSGVLPELYQVPVGGGRVTQVLTTPALDACFSKDGQTLVFHDRKGYEDSFRKHHTSSVTRDIWAYNMGTHEYTQLTQFEGEDRNPVFSPDQKSIYYLSEEKGDFNVFKMALGGDGSSKQISFLKHHPVRYLSVSANGLLCFSYNGELYTMREGASPQKVAVEIVADARYNDTQIKPVDKASEMALSPNGKEIAFIHRGEVFVTSIKGGTSKRITNTPEQERNISFSPDGRSLLYSSERNGSWNIYESTIPRDKEKYFFTATLIDEKALLETDKETFQPAYSPDGKEVAFLEERTTLKVINLATKQVREIMSGDKNYSYTDGDQHYDWSPDGKWFLVEFNQDKQWISQAGLVSAEGGKEPINLTQSGYNNGGPQWMMNGEMMIWFSDRDGMKNDASWGGEFDVYGMFFTQEAYDKFTLDEEAYELLQEEKEEEEKEEDDKKDDKKSSDKKDRKDKKESKDEEDKKVEPIVIELDGIEDRKVRLTVHSSRLRDAVLSKDGQTLYYLARYEKGADLWSTNLRTRETKILTKLGAKSVGDLLVDKDDKHLFVLADGKIAKIDKESGKREGVSLNSEMVLNEALEREYLFEHIWRQVQKKFYKIDLHEIDWDFYKTEYARFLPHINNNYDFANMLSEMLGELNASHTGARYWKPDDKGDKTAALGLFYDHSHTGKGLKIVEVMDKSPVVKSDSKIKAGVIIEQIDGQVIEPDVNHHALLNRKADKNTLLSLYDPATGKRWEETVKPISLGKERELRYQRWVDNCRAIVEKASGGKVGYVHVRGMNDRSYRTVYEEVLGKNHGKDALIVDTRFNGGGWLHDDLATFLDGKKYITFMPREQELGSEPHFKWSKPSIVVMSESNYSDAHMFPYTYRALGIGKLVGMPVPGTGTAVWWERLQNGMVFGIPQVGMIDVDGDYLENKQLEPDYKVPNDPGKVIKGIDQQLEEAVKVLLKVVVP